MREKCFLGHNVHVKNAIIVILYIKIILVFELRWIFSIASMFVSVYVTTVCVFVFTVFIVCKHMCMYDVVRGFVCVRFIVCI